jgi:YebC/PmpR family DNA-binding regulatory protein
MSGHSKWSQIKHKKGATDQKRGLLFSKLLKAVSVAAKENPDPQFNPRLRTTIQTARDANVPNENIERAITRSSEEKNLEEVVLEAYGPEKSALVVLGITDSRNRTIAEVRHLMEKLGLKPAEQGSVLWSFEKTQGEWKPKFTQLLSDATKQKVQEIVSSLEEHPDVQKVITNLQL